MPLITTYTVDSALSEAALQLFSSPRRHYYAFFMLLLYTRAYVFLLPAPCFMFSFASLFSLRAICCAMSQRECAAAQRRRQRAEDARSSGG